MRKISGQAVTESILLIPLFFLLVFGLLQIAQLGIAMVVTSYAASSVARKAASGKDFSVTTVGAPVDVTAYRPQAAALMAVGMQLDAVQGCIAQNVDPGSPTGELVVAIRTHLSAWPFFADLLHASMQDTYIPQGLACPSLENTGGFGPFNFSSQAPYTFSITANAKVRLNYVQ